MSGFFKSITERVSGAIQAMEAKGERAFTHETKETEQAATAVLEELQMEQVKTTREYQKLVEEKEVREPDSP